MEINNLLPVYSKYKSTIRIYAHRKCNRAVRVEDQVAFCTKPPQPHVHSSCDKNTFLIHDENTNLIWLNLTQTLSFYEKSFKNYRELF